MWLERTAQGAEQQDLRPGRRGVKERTGGEDCQPISKDTGFYSEMRTHLKVLSTGWHGVT